MIPWSKLGLALTVAGAAMMAGCSGGDAPVEVKFPDVSTLPKPVINEKKSTAGLDAKSQSQGDPSEYTR